MSDSRARKSSVVSVLDLGSSKVVCVIARLTPDDGGRYLHGRTHAAEVIGIGHTRSAGVKSGVIIDLEQAERSIRMAVEAAERMAGLTVDSIIVNLSAGRLRSKICSANMHLHADRPISKNDINGLLRSAVTKVPPASVIFCIFCQSITFSTARTVSVIRAA